MGPEFLLQLLAAVAAAAGVYAAIKSDLTKAIIKAEAAIVASDKAHTRIDTHLTNHP